MEKLSEFIEKYGGVMPPLTPDNIRVADYNSLTDEQKEKLGNARGYFEPNLQKAVVFMDFEKEKNNLIFATRVAHELIHFASFQSANANAEKKTYRARRVGLSMSKRNNPKNHYFDGINEGLTEELVKRFDKSFFGSIPVLAQEVQKRERLRKKSNEGDDLAFETINTVKLDSGMWKSTIIAHPYQYKNEREKLWRTIDDIFQKSKDFDSKEEIFDIFAKAYFTGNAMPVARLMEVMEKGSFRKLGEQTKEHNNNF